MDIEYFVTYLEVETQLQVVKFRHFWEQHSGTCSLPITGTGISHNATVLITKPAALGDSSAVLSWRRGC